MNGTADRELASHTCKPHTATELKPIVPHSFLVARPLPCSLVGAMSWRQCPPEDDSGPGLPLADAQTLPQRSKRAWCTLALDESDGPSRKQRRAAPPVRISGERSENQRSDEQVRERTFQCAFARKWCQLDISDDELPLQKQRRLAQYPRPGHPRQLNRDWRQLDLQGIGGG